MKKLRGPRAVLSLVVAAFVAAGSAACTENLARQMLAESGGPASDAGARDQTGLDAQGDLVEAGRASEGGAEDGPLPGMATIGPLLRPSGPVVINSDRTISIGGKKIFPVYIYDMCEPHFDTHAACQITGCDPSKNIEFSFGLGPTYSYSLIGQGLFEKNKMPFVLGAVGASAIPQSFISSPSMLGYLSYDEPDLNGISTADLAAAYQEARKRSSHPVILNICCEDLAKWAPYADIMTWDTYAFRKRYMEASSPDYVFPREDGIYAYEQLSYQNVLSETKDMNALSKPVWAVIQGQGVTDDAGAVPLTPKEARANAYVAITMGVKGIGIWGYKSWGGPKDPTTDFPHCSSGLVNDATLHAYYRQLGRELVGLNDILVLPADDYSWHFHKGTKVSFSKTLTQHVLWQDRENFNYVLKHEATRTYLIVVNKDSRPLTGVEVTISGLSGSMTGRTLGITGAGSLPGRRLTVTDGRFVDSFDGLAAHIYEIQSVGP